MKKFLLIVVLFITVLVGSIVLTPDRALKVTTKELAKEAEISPFMANFIINTKLGRKVAYLAMKKKMKKYFEDTE
jgi:hypothetical protein